MEAASSMSESFVVDLVTSYSAVLDAADRSLAIARALAEGYRAGLRPPDDVLDAYLVRIERDQALLKELRERAAELWPR
jgi:hypothetical protein